MVRLGSQKISRMSNSKIDRLTYSTTDTDVIFYGREALLVPNKKMQKKTSDILHFHTVKTRDTSKTHGCVFAYVSFETFCFYCAPLTPRLPDY